MEEKSITLRNISPKEHVCVSQQFDEQYLKELFDLADDMKKYKKDMYSKLKGKIIGLLFYEPSTRTRLSFESAANRLGARCITTENAAEFSSAIKGETMQDTIRMMNAYCDCVIIRHSDDTFCNKIVPLATIPIINAGSGKLQHPTQALLDVYTIYDHYRKFENLHIAVCGDLFRGRTVDSLVYLMSQFKGVTFSFISPQNSQLKPNLKEYLQSKNVLFKEYEELDQPLIDCDVLYMTRVQKERFDNLEEYEKAKGKCVLTNELANTMKENAIIMHPLPRVDEIQVGVDSNKRAKYFEQAENGVIIRMALLQMLLN